jgi:signal transduction histidine kinase
MQKHTTKKRPSLRLARNPVYKPTGTEEAKSRGDEYFRATVETMLDPFVMLEAIRDPASVQAGPIRDFLIVYANNAACQTAQMTREEMVGRRLLESMPGQVSSGLFDRFCQVVETGQPLILDGLEFEMDEEHGFFILDIRGTRFKDGLTLTWRDVTERVGMEEDLAEVQSRLAESVESERKKLASLLHDGPVQDLYAIDYQLHGLEQSGMSDEGKIALSVIQELLHQTIGTLLTTVGELRPQVLAPFGLKAAIQSNIRCFSDRNPCIQVAQDLDEDRQLLTEPLRLGLFRIYEKVIDNIERHARATRITVSLKIDLEQVLLSVTDNGVGFNTPGRWVTFTRAGRLGLASALDQARRLGGEMRIDSHPGSGTRVTVTWAFKNALPGHLPPSAWQ